ncbi:hypothetical protein LAh8_3 [Aeromonas phage LAh_8]|uniref:COOH.NH2 ligase-type 2 n=2 Tax=Lahexavirus TaxID=2843411 RepID=A0A514A0I9_9CAUD|nr:COOH.NH2 ligase [Aeromonas phage 4_4572]YP_009847341.1 COOH.NH2 ligase [Aeromonas phage LAh_8]QDH46745.1 hypothetical protein LAh8_3 [Aeromonas phage LAh_8]QEG09136.1 hypothetical protein [Aeromonas phage 4_4572]
MDNQLKFATDAELFVRDSKTGLLTSVAGLLGADKYNKRILTEDVRIQEDNVLLEFDINPHTESEMFLKNISSAMDLSRGEAEKLGFEVVDRVCSHIYTAQELETFHKDAFVFGCDPDFNALSGEMNPKPQAKNAGLRTAGAHVHIGYSDLRPVTFQDQQVLGVMCDYFLGLPSLLLDTGEDAIRRRELYGKAGSVRFKPYGIEYRTLSNFWVFDEVNRSFVWEQANKAFEAMAGDFMALVRTVDPLDVQNVINNGDTAMAQQYVKLLKLA